PRWMAPTSRALFGILLVGLPVLTILLGGLYGFLSLAWVLLGTLGGSAHRAARAGSEAGRLLLLGFVVAGGFLLIVVAPRVLGQEEAKKDREDLDRLPHVEITLRHSLGLPNEQAQRGEVTTGIWRLIRENNS